MMVGFLIIFGPSFLDPQAKNSVSAQALQLESLGRGLTRFSGNTDIMRMFHKLLWDNAYNTLK